MAIAIVITHACCTWSTPSAQVVVHVRHVEPLLLFFGKKPALFKCWSNSTLSIQHLSIPDKYLIAIVMTPIPDGEAQLPSSSVQASMAAMT